MAKKISYNSIRNINEDWTLDERNGYPYSGESVQEFIKKVLNEKGGDFYYDSETSKYLIFADVESRELYLSNREAHADLVIGTFDAPSNYIAEINMLTPVNNVILKGSKGNYIDFTFDVKSKTGSSTGEAVIATYTFNNAGNIKKVTQLYDAGTNVHFLVDEYLDDGANSVSVSIVGRSTLVGTLAAVNYNVVALTFTSSFNFGVPTEQNDYLSIPYHLDGAGVKYIEWYIDGVQLQDVDTIPDFSVNRTKSIDISELSVGKHNVQARAFTTNGGVNFYSSTLYFDFVVAPENEVWSQYTTFLLLGLVLSQPVTESISITATQYEDFSCQVAIYDSRGRSLDVSMTDNGSLIKTISMFSEDPQDVTYAPTEVGSHTIVFTVNNISSSITITVVAGEIDITEATDGLILKLSAKGRSNNESNPAVWTYDQISTTFSGFSWNAQDGWLNDSLTIPSGGSINVGLAPLSNNVVSTGRTIEIDFETTQVKNESATVMSIVNSQTNAGISITASSAKIAASGGMNVGTKYRDGDRIHLTFIVNKTTGDDARMMYIVNNGILERAARFTTTDNFNADGNIIIGSNGCVIRVHSIRVYNRALSVDEAFCNYAVDSPNLVSIATNNDIYDSLTGEINVDKVNAHIPVMIITGDISYILGITDKSQKNAWNPYPVNIEFRNMQNPEMNFFIDQADIRLQGTSSISYPRKNFRIYSASKSGKYNTKLYSPTHDSHDLISSGKYAFKNGSAPVNCWCLKADYAESSGSHNVGVAKLWNKLMYDTIDQNGSHPLRTDAQNWATEHEYPYDVRTTIDGFPIVLFQRDNENAPLICFGQYNFNNDKSTEDVYGFTALKVINEQGQEETFDNSHVECWEVLDSDNSIALFTDVSDFDSSWDNAFEARYPDKNTNVTSLKRVSQWINSCYEGMDEDIMEIDLEKWQEEKADYFDLPKLAAYYVYLLRFGAVDQTVKNAMFTTYDGLHWFYINYDNDTILGIDNASRLFSVWDYGLKTKTPQGGYYYAGKGLSVLWNCFEADPECMQLAKEIDEKLFAAGMTYENILQMFDNEQSSKWCERIYNVNGRYKYIDQALLGQNVLYMLQGSRKSHRHWWLQHRLEKYDNDFGTGTYTRRSIQARSTSDVNIPQGATYKFIPAKDANYGYSVASTVVDAPTAREAGVEYTSTGLPQATGVGNLIYIYNANNLYKLDLSGYITALGTVNLSSAINVNGESELKVLVLGDGENENNFLTNISGLTTIKDLEELDIRGYKAITSLDLENLPNLHTLKAEDSGLTSFVPASGSSITLAKLPSGIQSMILDGNTITSIDYTPTKTLNNVTISNVSGSWDSKSFVNTWLALFTDEELANVTINLTGINWTGMTAAQVVKIGKVGVKTLRGKVTLSSIDQEDYNAIVEVFGENVFNPSSQFVIDAPDSIFISGPSTLLSGEEGQFVATAFPVTENAPLYYLYNSGETQINTSGEDVRGFYYYTGSGEAMIKLYRDSGIVTVGSGLSSDATLKVKVRINNTATWSDFATIQCKKLVMPTVTITGGPGRIREIGSYDYPFTLGTYNAELQRIDVSLTAPSSVATVGLSGDKAVVSVLTVQGENTCTLRVSAVCKQGTVYVEKSIKITDSEVIMDSESNPEVLAVCYARGWCANADRMTATEALNVMDIGTAFQNNTQITHFEEFAYFKSVAVLQSKAFNGCSNLTALELPASVTKCNQDCFLNCSKLSYLKLPNSSLQMSQYVFGSYGGGGSKLQSAGPIGSGCNIEFAWTDLPYCAFSGCSALKSIIFPEGITQIGSQAFAYASLTGTIEIPDTVTKIGSQAFSSCNYISKIIVHKQTTDVGGAFSGMSLLQSAGPIGGDYNLEFGWETSIPTEAFRSMSNLTSITIPSSVTSIRTNAFYYCNNLSKLYISDISSWLRIPLYSYSDAPFGHSASDLSKTKHVYVNGVEIHDLVIPNSVTYISDYSFYGWPLNSVTLPDGVTSIGNSAFSNCRGLTSITVPNSVTSIGEFAFNNCSGLTSITISDSITSIADYAFYGCSGLTSVTIPDGVTSIGRSAFAGCSGLTSIIIPSSTTSIGVLTFDLCSGLTSITIPNGVTSIGNNAFSNCTNLTSVAINSNSIVSKSYSDSSSLKNIFGSQITECIIGNSVTSIGKFAFYDCSNLTSITIPSSVTHIGEKAFLGCDGLTSVHISDIAAWCGITFGVIGNPASLAGHLYLNENEITNLIIPDGVTNIKNRAFANCFGLISITIPNSVTKIGEFVFENCKNVETLTCLCSTAPTVGWGVFGDAGTTYIGREVPTTKTKTLYVPAGATGYDASYWADPLQASGKCNFVLSATL